MIGNEGTTWCAGANLKEQSARNEAGQSTAMAEFPDLLREIQASPTPVIARIAGHVVGGGNGLAAACDIALARDDVQFGFSEVRLPFALSLVGLD